MDRLWIALIAMAGAIVAALAGWAESKEAFNGRKFTASVLRALLAAAVFAIGYSMDEELNVADMITAFLAGGGIDVLGKRISGVLGNSTFPVPK